MKKILFIVVMMFSITYVSAQDIQEKDKINDMIKCEHTFDEYYHRIKANYEIIFETGIDAQRMYDNLMTTLYEEKNIFKNKIDGMYQLTVIEEDNNEICKYNIYLKDNKLKITANLISVSPKHKIIDNVYNASINFTLTIPKIKISCWVIDAMAGALKKFDF